MGVNDNNNYSNSVNPNQFETYLKKKLKDNGATDQQIAGSIFDSMSSERAESLEYFEETTESTDGTQEKTINAKEDQNASDADKAKDKTLIETLKGLFSIDGFKSKVDTNNDGVVDDKEMKKFLSDIKGLDGDNKNISLNDFSSALDKMGIDINKIQDAKKAEEEQVKKILEELNAPEQYENYQNQTPYVRSAANQNGVGGYNKNQVGDAQQLADVLTPGNTLEELKTQKSTLEDDIQKKEKNIADISSGTSEKLTAGKTVLDKAQQDMKTAIEGDKALKDIKDQYLKLKSDILANDNALTAKDSEISQKEGSISQAENSVSSLQGSLASLAKPTGKEEDKEKDASINARKTDLEKQIADKQAQVATLKTDLEKLKQDKATLDQTKLTLTAQNDKLEPEVQKAASPATQSAISAYEKAKTDLEKLKQTELSSAKLELDAKVKELNDVNSKIQEKENSKAEGLNFEFNENMTDAQKAEMVKFKEHFEENKDKYDKVSKATGIPAELVAALHWREGSGNFNTYMHNGDPLKDKNGNSIPTTHVPAGVLCQSWEESAIDALSSKNKQGLTSDSTDLKAYYEFAERYNGLGYRNKGVASPYVWSGTDNYSQGKYVADGKYDPNVKDQQLGVAAMLKEIMS